MLKEKPQCGRRVGLGGGCSTATYNRTASCDKSYRARGLAWVGARTKEQVGMG